MAAPVDEANERLAGAMDALQRREGKTMLLFSEPAAMPASSALSAADWALMNTTHVLLDNAIAKVASRTADAMHLAVEEAQEKQQHETELANELFLDHLIPAVHQSALSALNAGEWRKALAPALGVLQFVLLEDCWLTDQLVHLSQPELFRAFFCTLSEVWKALLAQSDEDLGMEEPDGLIAGTYRSRLIAVLEEWEEETNLILAQRFDSFFRRIGQDVPRLRILSLPGSSGESSSEDEASNKEPETQPRTPELKKT